MTSYHPKDIVEGYCGNCHDWTAPVKLMDKLLLVLESAEPHREGPLPYETWERLREECLAELRTISNDALRAL